MTPRLLLHLFFAILLLGQGSCASQQGGAAKKNAPVPMVSCPDDGNCSFEVLRNSSLELHYDQLGKLQPKVIEGDQIVIKYTYEKRVPQGTVDGQHKEYLYFEIDPQSEAIILQDKDLQKVKMVFGRICYCKKNMGYFKIELGELFVFHKNKKIQVRCSFDAGKVPQVIKGFDENVHYY